VSASAHAGGSPYPPYPPPPSYPPPPARTYYGPPPPRVVAPPPPLLLGTLSAVWATVWFGLVVLAFGIAPHAPPVITALVAILVATLLLIFVPLWSADPRWNQRHDYALIAGGLCGSMAVSFVGFIGALPMDLWFKIVVDAAAIVWLARLGMRTFRSA